MSCWSSRRTLYTQLGPEGICQSCVLSQHGLMSLATDLGLSSLLKQPVILQR